MIILTEQQIAQLESQGCSSSSWDSVSIDPACDLSRFRNVEFVGTVSVGQNSGSVVVDGRTRPCGLYDVTLIDSSVGRDVRIAHVGSSITRYDIEEGAIVENVGVLCSEDGAAFGVGTEIETVNEAGGRNVRLFPSMSAQTSFLQAFRLHDATLQQRISELVQTTIVDVTPERGRIAAGARLEHCGILRNICVGPHAELIGAAHIEDATILSCKEHPTFIGSGVQARHIIVAEGACVDSGALLEKAYVGQAVKVGKQFSAENCLFFANSEAFHGEAVAIFAGPYTVTHHKSTLLIAARFSFYNAGSGTNQSNHMYKLGPVHQGVFERGCKTGSFSYVLHETHVGAFSVVIGKHYTNINAGNLPFSNIHEADGQSRIVPGMNLFAVGTVRDGEKWPKRDGRKAPVKRDIISFDVFSPFTVEKMRRGRDMLRSLQEITPKDQTVVKVGGLSMKRLFLRKSSKFYQQAVVRYVYGKVLRRAYDALKKGKTWTDTLKTLTAGKTLQDPMDWVDIAGMLLPKESLIAVETGISDGSLKSMQAIHEEFARISEDYTDAEWEYVCTSFASERGYAPDAMTKEEAAEILEEYADAALSIQSTILDDSKKEYDSYARIGYGAGMDESEKLRDFEAVRGKVDKNSVVSKLTSEKVELERWVDEMKGLIDTGA